MPTRALVVDDEASIRILITRILELEGVEVRSAGSAAEGIRELQTARYDVVITDMRMETPDAGFEVLRFASALRPVPKLMLLSAYAISRADVGEQFRGVHIVQKGADTL